MTQAANYQVPAHPSGLDMRTQLNIIVAAILGDNCGPTAPTQTYPGMMWGDTTANRLRRRTNANDAWINIGPLDNFLGDITTQINTATANKVTKTGDTMTGALNLQFAYPAIQFIAPPGNIVGRLQGDSASGGAGFTDAANTVWNFKISDAGNATIRGNLGVSGAVTTAATNNSFAGRTLHAAIGASQGELGLQSPNAAGYMFIRGRAGGGIEYINNAYNAVVASTDDGGTLKAAGHIYAGANLYAGNGTGLFQTDGNVNGSAWGGWLSTYISNAVAGKSPTNTQIPWASGLTQMSNGNAYSLGSPWFMAGLSGPGNGTLNAIGIQAAWPRTP
jgi:hypothetical protein